MQLINNDQYNPLYVAVFPNFQGEEMSDCNWFDWHVIGHTDEAAVNTDVIRSLVKDFFKEYDLDPNKPDREYDWDAAHEYGIRAFMAFALDRGYTVFKPTRLNWLCT